MGNFFKRLFAKPDNQRKEITVPRAALVQASEASTAPLDENQIEGLTRAHRIEPPQLVVGMGRNQGRQRDNNEDALFAHTATISTSSATLPLGIFIVADGMGGHENGHIASDIAVRAMSNYLFKNLHASLFGVHPEPPQESLQEIMRQGVLRAHEEILRAAPGGGTTLTAALVLNSQMTVAHVGDSRAYSIFLDGRVQTLTRDHSIVKRFQELGQITAEEATVHPQKSMLYRALGQGDSLEPDVFTAQLPQPGYLLICSDGLWGVMTEDELFDIVVSAPNPQMACQSLVDAANDAGGPDNITAILVRLVE
ncbi:MAG: serine/threonine-protein phosphatase [Anaerolineae bacterium]|nr:MAG: serine/threonine-protein phosphatase [Anaerolineae bacterium]